MISIETSISETFNQTETSETSEDVFSQHFETDIQKLETEAPSQTLETGEDSQIPQSPSSAVLPHHHQPTGELETRLVKEYTIGKPCGFSNRLNKLRNQYYIWPVDNEIFSFLMFGPLPTPVTLLILIELSFMF